MSRRIYTIGHSTRTLAELLALLRSHQVTRLADIRRYPASRRYPHFSRENLERTVPEHGIEYLHIEDLGGRRRPVRSSENAAWKNDQFRGYADHMGTPEFHAAVDRLLESERPTAYMCAEAVPWRCHRNLLSDELVRRGLEVIHIVSASTAPPHALNSMARVEADRVVYPPPQPALFR